ncbi:MAG TPA: right-handed parallel beta-helix repeat-containing protein [Bacteroidota bacterium]
MKRLSVLSLLIYSFLPQAFGTPYSTPNTGVLWTLDSLVFHSSGTLIGSFPSYTLIDVLTVSQNDRLTILPGSVITVSQGSTIGFTVLGGLEAEGTPTDSIIVKGAVETPGAHRGFRIEDSAVDSLTRFAYCRIQDAAEAIHCLDSNPTISFCVFTNNGSNGVHCFNASPIVQNCLFIENRRSGMTVNLNSSPRIENNIFANNNFENTSPRNQITVGPQGVNNPIIRGNEISNQSYYRAGAISLVNIESAGACGALIENNYLHDNSFGILSQGLNMTPRILNNRIEENRINPDPLVSGSGITIQVGGPSNAPIITGNIIRENYWGITCYSPGNPTSSPLPNIGNVLNADTSDDGWNILENNNNGGVIYQLFNNATTNIFAQNNYWGSDDSSVVESWITHAADSSIYGTVIYHPFGIQGLGGPEYFQAIQQSTASVLLRWSFRNPSSSATIHLLAGGDSLTLSESAALPGTDSTFTIPAPFGVLKYYGLASSNRFGVSETTVVSFRISDITPPAQPQGLTITGGFFPRQSAYLTWSPNTEPDMMRYDIFRSRADTSMRQFLASVFIPDTSFADSTIECDTLYHFWLTAVDTSNNSSPASLQTFVQPCPLSVGDNDAFPVEYRLYQNFPNPFNPQTTIRFDTPHASDVRLTIVNLLGQEVATILSDRLPAGQHKVQWDGTNAASGTYMYRLVATDYVAVKKLLLLR